MISGCAKVGLLGNGKGPTFNISAVTPPTVIVTETPPPLAGFAVSSGGGISTGAGIQTNQPSGTGITVQATIGEPVGGATVQTGNGVTVISNLEGSLQ
jgi:hypothetical protein